MKETTIERKLRHKVRDKGGYAFKLGGEAGMPDRLVILPGGKAIFVETKKPKTGRLSERQKFMRTALAAAGFTVYIIDSEKGIETLLTDAIKK